MPGISTLYRGETGIVLGMGVVFPYNESREKRRVSHEMRYMLH